MNDLSFVAEQKQHLRMEKILNPKGKLLLSFKVDGLLAEDYVKLHPTSN